MRYEVNYDLGPDALALDMSIMVIINRLSLLHVTQASNHEYDVDHYSIIQGNLLRS